MTTGQIKEYDMTREDNEARIAELEHELSIVQQQIDFILLEKGTIQ